MLRFSPNPLDHLASMPLLSAYGMAQAMQAGRALPYSSGTSYAVPGGYGGLQGSMPGYASMEKGAPSSSQGSPAESPPVSKEMSFSSLLTASGVPNENGQLRWPLGLRILAAQETDALREQVNVLFHEAASQAAGGSVNAHLIQELDHAVNRLRTLLLKDKTERLGMPLAVYNESERFLNQLEHGAQVLKAGLGAPGGQHPVMTTSPSPAPASKQSTVEVGTYDNSFQPQTITAPVGATVQWTNHGHHLHTVTADDGQWGSSKLSTNAIYQHTFTRPGAYFYHCAVHPQELRGTIVVK